MCIRDSIRTVYICFHAWKQIDPNLLSTEYLIMLTICFQPLKMLLQLLERGLIIGNKYFESSHRNEPRATGLSGMFTLCT